MGKGLLSSHMQDQRVGFVHMNVFADVYIRCAHIKGMRYPLLDFLRRTCTLLNGCLFSSAVEHLIYLYLRMTPLICVSINCTF
jgi:hypothetical protein